MRTARNRADGKAKAAATAPDEITEARPAEGAENAASAASETAEATESAENAAANAETPDDTPADPNEETADKSPTPRRKRGKYIAMAAAALLTAGVILFFIFVPHYAPVLGTWRVRAMYAHRVEIPLAQAADDEATERARSMELRLDMWGNAVLQMNGEEMKSKWVQHSDTDYTFNEPYIPMPIEYRDGELWLPVNDEFWLILEKA